MARVKGGYVTRRRRKKILKLAKGYFGSKHRLFKTANAQVMKSLLYAYRDRRVASVISVNYGLHGLMQPHVKTVYPTAASCTV